MKRTSDLKKIKVLVGVLIFLVVPGMVHADVRGIVLRFQPYVSIQEEFTNNVDLTTKNKKEDYITTVYTGLSFSSLLKSAMRGELEAQPPSKGEKYGIDLAYRLGLVFYSKETDNNYISHLGNLKAWYSFTPRLTFRVGEYLNRSDAPWEQEYPGATSVQYVSGTFVDLTGLYFLGTDRRRAVYLRNVFSPSLEYKFIREGSFDLAYRSNIYRPESTASEKSREDFFNPKLTYQFNIRNGITLGYGLTFGHFDRSPDFTAHMGTILYTYRFDPRTAIFGGYGFSKHDSESTAILENDYDTHSPSVGVEYAFTPTMKGTGQIGYFWYFPKRGRNREGIIYKLSLSKREERTNYMLFFQGGYREDYFTAENLGPTLSHRAAGTVTHRVMEKMTAGLSGGYELAKSGIDFDRKDNRWDVSGNLSYQLLRWLDLSLALSYRENHSNVLNGDYREFHGLFSVTATYR